MTVLKQEMEEKKSVVILIPPPRQHTKIARQSNLGGRKKQQLRVLLVKMNVQQSLCIYEKQSLYAVLSLNV
jgi:hypothetical protein